MKKTRGSSWVQSNMAGSQIHSVELKVDQINARWQVRHQPGWVEADAHIIILIRNVSSISVCVRQWALSVRWVENHIEIHWIQWPGCETKNRCREAKAVVLNVCKPFYFFSIWRFGSCWNICDLYFWRTFEGCQRLIFFPKLLNNST